MKAKKKTLGGRVSDLERKVELLDSLTQSLLRAFAHAKLPPPIEIVGGNTIDELERAVDRMVARARDEYVQGHTLEEKLQFWSAFDEIGPLPVLPEMTEAEAASYKWLRDEPKIREWSGPRRVESLGALRRRLAAKRKR